MVLLKYSIVARTKVCTTPLVSTQARTLFGSAKAQEKKPVRVAITGAAGNIVCITNHHLCCLFHSMWWSIV